MSLRIASEAPLIDRARHLILTAAILHPPGYALERAQPLFSYRQRALGFPAVMQRGHAAGQTLDTLRNTMASG